MVSGEPLRSPLRLPLNLHISGTVNVDESTYSISDKLLDRANIIEMTEVDLTAFRTAYAGIIDEEVWRTLSQVHTVLARAGLQFGYRTIEEILRYFDNAAGVLTPLQALDLQLKQKVLPKLRGEDNPRLRRALGELLTLFLGVPHTTWETAAHIPDEQVAIAYLPASAEKTRRMLQRLEQHGYTDFYD
jgi:5-methylcytosine-specific restriction endonuclease McrBC GTP-binding regulatory subunit McrB